MVDTAPLPPDFPPGDTPPVRVPHPMEAWAAEPGMPGEQRVSRVLPGGGHVSATLTALANWEAGEAQGRRQAAALLPAAEIARRSAEHEAALEAKRLEQWPDPPRQLLEAQAVLEDAEAELRRHRAAADRGAAVLEQARERLAGVQAERQAAQNIAAINAAAVIAGGGVLPEMSTPLPDAGAAARAVEVAAGAHQQLEVAVQAAAKVVERAKYRAYQCDHAVKVDDADHFAGEILDLEARLAERRGWLRTLANVWVQPPGRPGHPVMLTPRARRALG